MLRFISLSLMLLVAQWALAQTGTLQGRITDATTGEGLISATVGVNGTGTYTDLEGNYTIELKPGKYEVQFSYVGYQGLTLTAEVKAGEATMLDAQLKSDLSFQEVVLTADIAIDRKTPVAFSNISTQKLAEELASQDLPMILNSTPGVYATQTGGGDGDARINIRGFDQRNVAVMLDGIPVNDMENGWVYWSNWFGLDLVTKTMQVQRGLGASKLAIPSVGGTINILTNGIDAKKGLRVRQEIGTGQFSRTTLGINSGRLDNGWGVSVAASYKKGNGWVEQTFTEGFFYYLRVDKEIGNHLISFSGFGAPQTHGQRPFKDAIGIFNKELASELIPDDGYLNTLEANNVVTDVGRRFNNHWGYLDGQPYNTRQNYYHKPQLSLRHFWNINNRTTLSNVAYLSIGRGGGLAPYSASAIRVNDDGRLNLDEMYTNNATPLFGRPDAVSTNFIRSSVNNHFWYGVLSTLKTEISDVLTFSGGLDLRYYEGDHYREVNDLFGGEYFIGNDFPRVAGGEQRLVEGDRFDYDNTGFVRWGGAFGLLEYTQEKLSAFVNLSGATVAYSLEDYMKPKALYLADTTVYFGADSLAYTAADGTVYDFNSDEVVDQRIDWVYRPSFSIKSGASYNFNDNHTGFVNIGYLSRPTRFNNVIQSNGFAPNVPIKRVDNLQNEIIWAIEGGYQFRSKSFSMNFNAYWTNWLNRPLDRVPTILEDPEDPQSDRIPVNVEGIAALHRGVELDFAWRINKQWEVQGLSSLGDWIWNSSSIVTLPDGSTYEFDPKGVHVGDAAQLQFGGMVQYRPIKGAYIKVRGTYFGKNYASFNPETLKGPTAGRESWKMPDYFLLDAHAGYSFKWQKTSMQLRGSLINALDTWYISDATNNDGFISPSYTTFDAKAASVFFGQGRRWNVSLTINL